MWVYSIVFGMFTIVASQLISVTAMMKMTTDRYAVTKMYNGFTLIRHSVQSLRGQKNVCLIHLADNQSVTGGCLDQGLTMSGYDFSTQKTLYRENYHQALTSSPGIISTFSREQSAGKVIIAFYSSRWNLHNLAYQFSKKHLRGVYGILKNHLLYSTHNTVIKVDDETSKMLGSMSIPDGVLIYIF